jgi:hypothetical protein
MVTGITVTGIEAIALVAITPVTTKVPLVLTGRCRYVTM